ncbi:MULTISPECIES: gamma-glutamylcyclotransferase [Comamonas]|jgi:cation transport protein ChaC|uniref:glutathione-specific gamma-glutamylcyclotransferase n=1 Tax=Comamonas squillarum TaxID=2977320 RepID=A0ABY5ZZ75_9BURK|nr:MULTISPECIES: gamma-glutamylcyclotransferase [Comamonas]PWB18794.1 gamma-glutamylcyclotransferase [Comamonas sp. JNW]UXC19315.1 gamma-glutamylcyclotransferase [Comamonas sp. PR12]
MTNLVAPSRSRCPQQMLAQTMQEWGGTDDLWVFAYGSLIWRPEFEFLECRHARVFGWHRALKMWSHINRGTPECPGLVFGMFSGGSCRGMAFRIARQHVPEMMPRLWQREMATDSYDPKWLDCQTEDGPVKALAFTLSKSSPRCTGTLSEEDYRRIFAQSCGIYGTTLDYAESTYTALKSRGIQDRALERLLRLSASRAHAGQQARSLLGQPSLSTASSAT